ncbi:MAG: hypothetical protein LQ344_003569 [Seirophora lacunosa]|nr:MAG: hypothetical protein LQ344_003569 [Seirophora lacunosa]
MAPTTSLKRKHEKVTKSKAQRPIKKFKKQTHYSSPSSSDDEEAADEEAADFAAIDLANSPSASDSEASDPQNPPSLRPETVDPLPSLSSLAKSPPSSPTHSSASASSTFASLSDSSSKSGAKPQKKTSKRNDPSSFAAAITSILASKLPNPKRADPVLARSSSALAANTAIRESALERRARQQLRAEKKALMEKGRIRDVLLGTTTVAGMAEGEAEEGQAAKIMEEEKRLKKTAQRGVLKLFNAVRMAQVRGEEARKEALGKGVVGAKRKEERVGEMSKKGFLELVASGGAGGSGKGKGAMMGGGQEIEEG